MHTCRNGFEHLQSQRQKGMSTNTWRLGDCAAEDRNRVCLLLFVVGPALGTALRMLARGCSFAYFLNVLFCNTYTRTRSCRDVQEVLGNRDPVSRGLACPRVCLCSTTNSIPCVAACRHHHNQDISLYHHHKAPPAPPPL